MCLMKYSYVSPYISPVPNGLRVMGASHGSLNLGVTGCTGSIVDG